MICLTQSVARWRANSEHVQNRVEGSRAVHTRMRLRGGWREPGKKRLKAPPRQHPMNYGNTFSLDIYFFYIKGGWKKAVSIRWDREGWGGEIIKKNSSIAYSLFFLYMDLFKSSFHLFAFFGDVGRDFLFLFLFLFLFFLFWFPRSGCSLKKKISFDSIRLMAEMGARDPFAFLADFSCFANNRQRCLANLAPSLAISMSGHFLLLISHRPLLTTIHYLSWIE